MPNIASLLKSEITRLSRKEIRRDTQVARKATSTHRREIAALKRRVAELERLVKRTAKGKVNAAQAANDAPKHRFVAKGLRPLRTRLDLSAEQFAMLLGVSAQSVYNWEHQKATPRSAQIAAIAKLRSLGKRAAQSRLAALKASTGGRRKASKARRKTA